VKCWTYKGEILDGGRRDSLKNEPEPRRQPLRDRRERRPPMGGSSAPPPVPVETGGSAVQSPPEGAAPRTAPILPPLAPPQPNWKQELKQDTPSGSGPASTGSANSEPGKE
jgi:hypothetical protein